MEKLIKDVRHALRMLARSPGFTAVAVAALALGIGANTAIFSVVNGILLQPLPYSEPDRMVRLAMKFPDGNGYSISIPKYVTWKANTPGLSAICAYNSTGPGLNLSGGSAPEQVKGIHVSAGYFQVFDAAPALGRVFSAEEDRPNGPMLAVLSHGLWQRRFGGDPSVIGRVLVMNGEAYSVIGVLRPSFRAYPPAEIFLPLQADPNSTNQGHYLSVAGRLKPGVRIEAVQAQMAAAAERFRATFPKSIGKQESATAEPLGESMVGDVKKPLLILLGAVALVLLIACANVANLLLARATHRSREVAIRVALGAGRWRIIQQLLTESILLALMGGGAGFVLGAWGVRGLIALSPTGLPRAEEFAQSTVLDWRVLLFSLAVAMGTGILFGLFPALQISRTDVHGTLKEASSRAGTGRRHWARNTLVVTEIALALILLVGAALLIRTFTGLRQVRAGFNPQQVLAFETSLSGSKYKQTAQVEQLSREVVRRDPDNAGGWLMLGIVARQRGRLDQAIDLVKRATELRPAESGFWGTYAAMLGERGRLDEALKSFARAVNLAPDDVEIRYNFGRTLWKAGRLDEAAAAFEATLRIKPGLPQAYHSLGKVLHAQGRVGEAIEALHRAVELKPDYADVWNDLGLMLQETGKLAEAVGAFETALRLKATPGVLSNLGTALRESDRLDEAIGAYRAALQAAPDSATIACNLGMALSDVGEVEQGLDLFRKSIALGTDRRAWDNYLFTLHVATSATPGKILEEHQTWNELVARPAGGRPMCLPFTGERSTHRRLRVGYVSPDFRGHSQSFYTVPLLSHHDHEAFEIFCYSDVTRPDDLTARIRGYADVWREIRGRDDETVARLIHEDRIDILIDLTMHMAGNRLLTFARKSAPVQVTWLAYPGTTGLSAMDWRVSDPYLDPGETDEAFYSERTVRPGRSFWCYDPLSDLGVNDLPAEMNGFVTFGCFNSFFKVSKSTLELWSRVLGSVPGSRLMLLSPRGSARERVAAFMMAHGINPARIKFVDRQPRAEYLRLYHQVDLCLDSVPYPGHTTTFDAMWMGVPVVTLAGTTAVSRGGFSILSNAGLGELVAWDVVKYVEIVSALAADVGRLKTLRGKLRERMKGSVLMDAAGFTRAMEAAYRRMWGEFVAGL